MTSTPSTHSIKSYLRNIAFSLNGWAWYYHSAGRVNQLILKLRVNGVKLIFRFARMCEARVINHPIRSKTVYKKIWFR